jgi:hypothetical protein
VQTTGHDGLAWLARSFIDLRSVYRLEPRGWCRGGDSGDGSQTPGEAEHRSRLSKDGLGSTCASTRQHPEVDGIMRERSAVCGQEYIVSHDSFEGFPVDPGHAT